ncbi:MAG: GMC family oxidoreductase [Rhodothermales bacterium]
MLTDARTLENGTLIEGDLCIVGAGAAGISMALEWAGRAERVLLLEGGGFSYDPALQDLYRGDITGEPYLPIEAVRLHYFGGTTGHWAGFCAPIDPLDFEPRDWVPYSGWPIRRADLDAFYTRAQTYLQLGPFDYEAAHYESDAEGSRRLPFDPGQIWSKMWQFSPPTRFGEVYRDAVVSASNIHLVTYANATELVADEAVRQIDSIRVKTIEGKEHRVRARHYVLACGSIQNARLLLASNARAKNGIGNDSDQVGRYFMEHIEMAGAQLVLKEPDPLRLYALNFATKRPRAELALGPDAQRSHRVLSGTCSLRPGVYGETITSYFTNYRERLREAAEGRVDGTAVRSVEEPPKDDGRSYQLQSRAEQSPNPDSRVVLTGEVDALGMPRAALEWRFTELDKRSIRVFYQVLAREFGRLDLGRIQILDWLLEEDDRHWPDFLSAGRHHMGTTRMSDDPGRGVVDADSKVHGMANLHVTGASVFVTAGAPNPTLTLVALALRLSDRLKAIV